ncbi:hypothetical protein JW711_04435 [Candidatus Woesearchaeota archaeon]|nr:hypothetical protein [Candidatus Woesearchaeota archaeon]
MASFILDSITIKKRCNMPSVKTRTQELSDRINWNSPNVKAYLIRKSGEEYYSSRSRQQDKLIGAVSALYHAILKPSLTGLSEPNQYGQAEEHVDNREFSGMTLLRMLEHPIQYLMNPFALTTEFDNKRIERQSKDLPVNESELDGFSMVVLDRLNKLPFRLRQLPAYYMSRETRMRVYSPTITSDELQDHLKRMEDKYGTSASRLPDIRPPASAGEYIAAQKDREPFYRRFQ